MNYFKEHRDNIIPEQVGAPSDAERKQQIFENLDPGLKAALTSLDESQARKIQEQKILEEREELIRRGKNPDQKELF